ncbi:MAG: phosphate-starvation-inducible PsiE family protein [Cytophagales bacterium]|nr:phosphate-starvation-inducible PsiE family protein [Cytophagales bacterium]
MKQINKILHAFTWVLIGILGLILVYSTFEYLALVIRTIINRTTAFDLSQKTINVDDLFLVHVQGLIAGILLITIIIELIHTLLSSLDENKRNNYLAILFEIGTIAVIRHLFIYELDHIKGINVIGIALLLLVLGLLNLVYRPGVLEKFTKTKK